MRKELIRLIAAIVVASICSLAISFTCHPPAWAALLIGFSLGGVCQVMATALIP